MVKVELLIEPPKEGEGVPLGSYKVLSDRTSSSDSDVLGFVAIGLLVGDPVRNRVPIFPARASGEGRIAQTGLRTAAMDAASPVYSTGGWLVVEAADTAAKEAA